MRRAPEGAGRFDRLHGDEDEIAAERELLRRERGEYLADQPRADEENDG